MGLESLIPSAALRLIGAFYCLGSIFGAWMITRYSFIDHAIEAISGKRTPTAETLREGAMLAGLLPVFAAGLALMFLSPLSPWLFAAGVVWQAVYLGWLAPRILDPADAPEPGGRAKTWRAFALYIVSTGLVLWAAFAGLLAGPSGLLAAGLGAAATIGFGVWAFRRLLNPMDKSIATPNASTNSNEYESGPDEPAGISVILRPSWNDGVLFDQATGEPVSWRWQEAYLSEQACDLLSDVNALFRRYADPYDPRRCALLDPADAALIVAGVQDALAIVRQELGAERVEFEPLPAPVEPEMSAARVKIEPFHLNSTIWSLDEPAGGRPRPIYADHFGISWSLARHLDQWALDWHEAQGDDAQTPEEPPAWSEAQAAAHEEEGRVLAVRLARELAATGRDVVVFHAKRTGLRAAHSSEAIPPLPPAMRDA
ncbi:MAG: hypothetical protein K2Y29_15470 [Beijerinckiaceae bacterium]|nr:hypothetical protein [Beijerinckiaceae bacterium]